MTTEMATLKMKKRTKKATPEDLERLKVLQDGEPLSAADLEEAKKREEDRKVADKKAYDERTKVAIQVSSGGMSTEGQVKVQDMENLDQPPEHPRIAKIKEALLPFTQIEAHPSRPDEFVLFVRGTAITAGDVRKARKAMKL